MVHEFGRLETLDCAYQETLETLDLTNAVPCCSPDLEKEEGRWRLHGSSVHL